MRVADFPRSFSFLKSIGVENAAFEVLTDAHLPYSRAVSKYEFLYYVPSCDVKRNTSDHFKC